MQDTTPPAEAENGPRIPARAGRREWLGLAVLALPTLLVALDINVLFLALPQLSQDLGAGGIEQLWITDIYGFMVAGFVVTMGTLGDRIGRRRLLLIGGAAFALLSLPAAWASSPGMLIACRALLGIAGATLMPSTLALITTMFRDARQRGVAIATWATCQFGGAAVGPVIGGLLLERFWWGSVFLLSVPMAAVLLLAGPALLPEHRDPDAGRVDPSSVALSLAALLPLVYGVKHLATGGGGAAGDPRTAVSVTALAVGAVFTLAFVRRQLRLTNPLLDLRLLRQRSVGLVLTSLTLAGVAMAGTGLLVTQYLRSVVGLTPLSSALWFAPMGLGVALGTTVTPALTRRVRAHAAIGLGLALSAVGGGVLLTVESGSGPWPAVAAISLIGLGTGPLFARGTATVVGAVKPARAGAAASMSETSNYLGGTLGTAILGTAAAAVYGQRMADADAVPTGVPAQAVRQARETMAGAVGTAAELPAGSAAELIRAAHTAYVSGLHTVGLAVLSVFALLAVLVGALFPREDAAVGEGSRH